MYMVRMSLSLPITLSQFNASSQRLLRQQIAATAGLNAETGWTQVNINVQSLRLIDPAVIVDVTIACTDSTAANTAAMAFSSPDRLNAALASVGLPPVYITSPPVVTVVITAAATPSPQSSSGSRRGMGGGLASVAALLAVMRLSWAASWRAAC